MIEHLDYYNDLDQVVRKPRLLRFRDPDTVFDREKKLRPWQRSSGFGAPPKRTLLTTPDDFLGLASKVGLPSRLLSREALEHVETFFKRTIVRSGLSEADLKDWLVGKKEPKQNRIVKRMRGRIFEEIIVRDFILANPNYFVANPALTHYILSPMIGVLKPGEISIPDHLVFAKYGVISMLVGFMEDKKALDLMYGDEILEQLENEWNLWLRLSQDYDLQARFRRETLKRIPTMPYRIRVATSTEGKIWLAVTKDRAHLASRLLSWIEPFPTSVSNEVLNRLTESLIVDRFLPRLLETSQLGIFRKATELTSNDL